MAIKESFLSIIHNLTLSLWKPTSLSFSDPKTLDEVVIEIIQKLSSLEIDYIFSYPPEASHDQLGRHIRNKLNLWKRDSTLVQWFIDNLRISHADDISGTILAALWAKVRCEPFNAQEYVKIYHQYWASIRIDPITLKPIT